MSISAVITARNHDILRLQPQECVFLYYRHWLIKKAMSVKTTSIGALWENFLVSERKKRNALLFVTEGDLPG